MRIKLDARRVNLDKLPISGLDYMDEHIVGVVTVKLNRERVGLDACQRAGRAMRDFLEQRAYAFRGDLQCLGPFVFSIPKDTNVLEFVREAREEILSWIDRADYKYEFRFQ